MLLDKALSKQALYSALRDQASSLVVGERDFVANLANLSALLFMHLPDVNWAGFYLLKDEQLVLGPFQGKPACIRISVGRGVCGTAAQSGKSQLVEDVHQFDGHIACDVASRSEVVIPVFKQGSLIGVLDVDSPLKARFDQQDLVGLQAVVDVLEQQL